MAENSKSITEKLAALRENFSRQLPARVANIGGQLLEMRTIDGGGTLQEQFRHAVHSLAGAAGTFGYPRVSAVARTMEQAITATTRTSPALSSAELAQLNRLFPQLEAAANAAPAQAAVAAKPFDSGREEHGEQSRRVLVLDDDPELCREMTLQLALFGYSVHACATANDALAALAGFDPDALVIDIQLGSEPLAGPAFVARARQQHPDLPPVIFASIRDDFEARLSAVHCGGDCFITKPIGYHALVDQLDRLMKPPVAEPYRILIVDDSTELAEHHGLVLRQAGMQTTVVTDPRQVLEAAAEARPDLIVMDLYMPGCSGIEVAKVIRQDDCFNNLPIVFLSTETTIDQQLEALRYGGDEFLQKPISDDHLVQAVSIRVERFRQINTLLTCDGLTGLLSHVAVKLELEAEISRSQRSQSQLSVAMIDIDHFKKVNDTYGHPAGDRVIKSLARLIKQSFRKSDLVGRYGGEEFIVVFKDTPPDRALTLIDTLRDEFSRILFSHPIGDFSSTLSAGICGVPFASDAAQAISHADQALYQAKVSGRNRTQCASPPPLQAVAADKDSKIRLALLKSS